MNQYVSYTVCFRYKLKLIMKNHSLIESLIIGVEKFSRFFFEFMNRFTNYPLTSLAQKVQQTVKQKLRMQCENAGTVMLVTSLC